MSKLPIVKTLLTLLDLAKRKTFLLNLAKNLFAKACENWYLRNFANLAISMGIFFNLLQVEKNAMLPCCPGLNLPVPVELEPVPSDCQWHASLSPNPGPVGPTETLALAMALPVACCMQFPLNLTGVFGGKHLSNF